jgi:hypothetical protein
MFNYEGFRYNTGGNGLTRRLPQAMAGGDFSALLQPVTINGTTYPAHILYDYTTCTGANQGLECQPYGGAANPTNIIPAPGRPGFHGRCPVSAHGARERYFALPESLPVVAQYHECQHV